MTRALLALLVLSFTLVPGCGKKGPALAPELGRAAQIRNLRAVQLGDEIALTCALPQRYQNGDPFVLERIEVLVLRAAEGDGEEIAYIEERIPLAMADVPGQSWVDPLDEIGPKDVTEARSGEEVEASGAPILPEVQEPELVEGSPEPDAARKPDVAADVAAPVPDVAALARQRLETALRTRFAADALPVLQLQGSDLDQATMPRRIYLRLPTPEGTGLTALSVRLHGDRTGRSGVSTNVVLVDVGEAVAAPDAPEILFVESGFELAVDGSPERRVAVFRYFAGELPAVEMWSGRPIEGPRIQDTGVRDGREICYALATVEDGAAAGCLSAQSVPVCLRWRDTYPPAVASGVSGFPSDAGIFLTWNASTSDDVIGYYVYRRVGEGEPELLTKEPVVDRSYLDETAEKAITYTYFVTAVDNASPGNESAPSDTVSETVAE